MTGLFAALAAEHGLLHKDASTGALSEEYLYSSDIVHRYAFRRWWGHPDPGISDVWVLFNPRRATPSSGTGPLWNGASSGPGPRDGPAWLS